MSSRHAFTLPSRLTRRATLQGAAATLAGAALHQRAPRVLAQATPLPEQGDALAPDTRQAVMELITDALTTTETPGALVGVWAPGHGVAMVAAGLGAIEPPTSMSLDDHFRIASITKTFTATVVLQLAAEDRLGLDDALADYIDGIPNGAEITLRQMLGMRSGIFDYLALPIVAQAFINDPTFEFGPEQAVEAIRRRGQADFAPGASYRYSNSNYILLGLIIEQVTGQAIADVMAERIIGPLGLTGTSFPTTPELPPPYAHGYVAASAAAPLRDASAQNPSVAWTAGAMVSTLLDLKVWAAALATGELLTPELHAAQVAFETETAGGVTFGYGLGVLTLNGMLGHNGGVPGYLSWMLYDPATTTTFVVLTNRSGLRGAAADAIVDGLGRLFLPEQFAAAPGATPAATPVTTPLG